MRLLATTLLFLIVSVVLALIIKQDNGYVLLAYGQWTVEGSLAFFVLVNGVVFGLLYFLIRAMVRAWGVPGRVRNWREQRGLRKARNALTQGLLELSEGHWKSAEKSLIRHAEKSETPLLNYLAAARSAQQQGAHEKRDLYLQLAHESMPSADVAVALTQAELQLDHEQYEHALATLMHLRQIAPRHAYVLKLLKELYERLGDWEQLRALIPELKKRKVVEKEELERLECAVFEKLLEQASAEEGVETLVATWKGLPGPMRNTLSLARLYSDLLVAKKRPDLAEPHLREAISREWSEALVGRYGAVAGSDPAQQLTVAERWLQEHPRSPELLLALGRLSLRNKLWGKARSYMEASLGIAPTTDACLELGVLLEKMGECEKAIACFRSGLEISRELPLPEIPDLPALTRQPSDSVKDLPTDINPPKRLSRE